MEMFDVDRHTLALRLTLDWLNNEDVVSCGQVCRKWRWVSSSDNVWYRRFLQPVVKESEDDFGFKVKEANWKGAHRVLLFAPCMWGMNVTEIPTKLKPVLLQKQGLKVKKLTGLVGKPGLTWISRIEDGKEVREVTQLSIEPHFTWSLQLLQLLVPQLEELKLSGVKLQHLQVIKEMSMLKKLDISSTEFYRPCPILPDLPLQLEELRIDFSTLELLKSIKRMSKLRRLEVLEGTKDCPEELPPNLEELKFRFASKKQIESLQHMPQLRRLSLLSYIPDKITFSPQQGSLQWLEVELRSSDTMMSLISAHRSTLLEVEIHCPSEGESEEEDGAILNLALRLKRCAPVALQRVVLRRGEVYWDGSRFLHGEESCARQLQEIRDQLVWVDNEGLSVTVTVLCSGCSKLPDTPL